MRTDTPANSIFDGPVTNLLLILRILIVLSRAHVWLGWDGMGWEEGGGRGEGGGGGGTLNGC